LLEDIPLERSLRLGLQELGLDAATQVQALAVPAALAGRDLLISAETGSGKTLAYLLPLAQHLLAGQFQRRSGCLALVLVPTRELARQVLQLARKLLLRTPLRVIALTGGADFRYQSALLRKEPEIVIATPGRLLEHCEKGSARLDEVQTLVLDEADRMLDMGFRDDVMAVAGFCPGERQTLMVSATLGHTGVAAVARSLLRTPQDIAVGEQRQPHSSIVHQVILADSPEHKRRLLGALLLQGGFRRALVFANTRDGAAQLAQMLAKQGLRVAALHGEMSTEERKRTVQLFRDGRVPTVCASDVAARGLDIPELDLVVNYDMPRSGDDYLHRSGRTGRAGAMGLAVSLVMANEWNLMISIQRYLRLDFQRRALPGLKARYNGPKKQKSSGKAAGSKKPKARATGSRAPGRTKQPAAKTRTARDHGVKNSPGGNDGTGPLLRKKPVT